MFSIHLSSILILIFSFLFSCSNGSLVKWIPNTSFNVPINFKDGKLPCSKQTVVFPENLIGAIRLEAGTSVNGFVLPDDGQILLSEGEILLGPDIKEGNCTEENVYFIDKSLSSWAQPDVWSSDKYNKATPDAERLPCYDDVVVFPEATQFTIQLPDATQYVKGLKIGGQNLDTNAFNERVVGETDEAQQFVMNEQQSTGVQVQQYPQCLSRAGCPCQRNRLKIDCMAKYCYLPTCVDPVQPIGHCCKICGGVISFGIDESFDLMVFREVVDKIIESYGKNNFDYHLSRISNKEVQLVVIDKNEYTGLSAEVVNKIDNSIEKHWVQGSKLFQISGTPLYKQGLGLKIFISMFFVVVTVLGSIYLYYYRMPEIRMPSVPSFNGPRGMMSRFHARSDSVVSLTRRDSTVTVGGPGGRAFRNPLYDSKRGRVQVVETVVAEDE